MYENLGYFLFFHLINRYDPLLMGEKKHIK